MGEPIARYSLVRWMIDPALGLEELEAEEEEHVKEPKLWGKRRDQKAG